MKRKGGHLDQRVYKKKLVKVATYCMYIYGFTSLDYTINKSPNP